MRPLFLILLLIFTNFALADAKKPLTITATHDGLYTELKFEIADGWKLYANKKGEIGYQLNIDLSKLHNLSSHEIVWPEPKTFIEEIEHTKLQTHYYERELHLPIALYAINAEDEISGSLIVEYGACADYCIQDSAILKIKTTQHAQATTSFHQFLYILMLAALGGLILNFMPCVLPVLSLKLMGLLQHSNSSQKTLVKHFLATTAGILVSFLLLALLTIFLQQSGNAVGWGLHFQEPLFVMFLILILMIFSSNLWGDFEIMLPSGLNNKISNSLTGTVYGAFLGGIFTTILATPCTISFISTAMAFALSRGALEICAIYLAIGMGMSLPYIFGIFFPKTILRLLPRPGEWMEVFKKILSLTLFGTAIWLLYVLSGQIHIRSTLIFIGGLLLMKFVMLREWKIGIKLSIFFILLSITFILPMTLESQITRNKIYANHMWEDFDEEKLSQYVKSNRIVFVDFTADWCITCKVNKFITLDNPNVISYLKKKNIVLMRADLTGIKSADGAQKIKEYNSFLAKHKRYGIPFNAIFSENEQKTIVLPIFFTLDDLKKILEVSEPRY